MPRLNQTRYALLGLLTLGPNSGYGLRKLSERSIAHFWKEGYGQIYPTLKSLEEEGLTTAEPEQTERRPDRKVYTITARGRRELARWLKEPIGDEVWRNELLLKTFFSENAGPGVALARVKREREKHQALIKKYGQITGELKHEHRGEGDLVFWLMTLNFGLKHSEGVLDWCDEVETTLRGMKGRGRQS